MSHVRSVISVEMAVMSLETPALVPMPECNLLQSRLGTTRTTDRIDVSVVETQDETPDIQSIRSPRTHHHRGVMIQAGVRANAEGRSASHPAPWCFGLASLLELYDIYSSKSLRRWRQQFLWSLQAPSRIRHCKHLHEYGIACIFTHTALQDSAHPILVMALSLASMSALLISMGGHTNYHRIASDVVYIVLAWYNTRLVPITTRGCLVAPGPGTRHQFSSVFGLVIV